MKVPEYTLEELVFEAIENAIDNSGADVFDDMTSEEVARDIAERTDIGVDEAWNKEAGEYDKDEFEAAIAEMTKIVDSFPGKTWK